MEIFFHTRTGPDDNWNNQGIELKNLARLPVVGEYISLSNDEGNSDWHRVDMVVHVAFKAGFVAEVYCTAFSGMEAMRQTGLLP